MPHRKPTPGTLRPLTPRLHTKRLTSLISTQYIFLKPTFLKLFGWASLMRTLKLFQDGLVYSAGLYLLMHISLSPTSVSHPELRAIFI
ncbi:hypothetical protein P170DRAFT_167564 [Aspergillus steynii IBT 23096]|uniref:Uncharacterized protein n=1 Tax=Aspergillus steynii IBT 23096 TaxID=1392250 RepID=A0A2I2G788_9EURO|nr:uncharacterized protein P170DRAFT_167564 [Aspergillus steynii IBT 23096]PLB48746.1 hypothetical protein P170DRAFT_167564 [Aspergillus steynii IBT 23096]